MEGRRYLPARLSLMLETSFTKVSLVSSISVVAMAYCTVFSVSAWRENGVMVMTPGVP